MRIQVLTYKKRKGELQLLTIEEELPPNYRNLVKVDSRKDRPPPKGISSATHWKKRKRKGDDLITFYRKPIL